MSELSAILKENGYVGRGIVLGQSSGGRAVLVYFIMGRSAASRERMFELCGDSLVIRACGSSDPVLRPLTVYTPLRVAGGSTVISNGDHTDTIFEHLKRGYRFEDALDTRCFEPDAPHYTPRISGVISMDEHGFIYKLGIVKAGDPDGVSCHRQVFSYEPLPGRGHFIHTYRSGGPVLQSFSGEPLSVSIPDDIKEFAKGIWESLHPDNKVSLCVRYIDVPSGEHKDVLINKNSLKERL